MTQDHETNVSLLSVANTHQSPVDRDVLLLPYFSRWLMQGDPKKFFNRFGQYKISQIEKLE